GRDYTGYQCLFKSDGTSDGTVVVKRFTEITPEMGAFAALGDKLIFRARDTQHSDEPWISDGTELGTHLLKDLGPGSQNSSIGSMYVWNNKVFFTGWGYDSTDKYVGIEPYVSDGTPEGTHLLKDIWPGDMNGYPVWWKEA